MKQHIVNISLIVKDYDEAIEFFTKKLHFILIEDTKISETKRWVVIAPSESSETRIVLGKATTPGQENAIGNQTGGRVFLSLYTNNFEKDYEEMISVGISFVRKPKQESYGKVAVFTDLYGNLWDLIQYTV